MRRKKTEYTGYVSKSGNLGLWKIVARFTTDDGTKRAKLEGFGKEPFTFWVDESKLCDPPPPKRRPNEETRQCWECGCDFTYREAQHRGGDWGDSYCGC